MSRMPGVRQVTMTRQSYSPGSCKPVAIMFHRTAGTNSLGWLRAGGGLVNGKDVQVSTHMLVDRQGSITQFLGSRDSAWHAGVVNLSRHTPTWIRDRVVAGYNPNDFVFGVENEASGADQDLTDPQIEADIRIARWLCEVEPVPRDRAHIIGHYQTDIVRREFDPWGKAGALYPWDRVIRAVRAQDNGTEPVLSPGRRRGCLWR